MLCITPLNITRYFTQMEAHSAYKENACKFERVISSFSESQSLSFLMIKFAAKRSLSNWCIAHNTNNRLNVYNRHTEPTAVSI